MSHTHEDMPDKPPLKMLWILVLACFLFVFVVCLLAYEATFMMANKISNEIDSGMGNEARLSYIQTEDEFLNSNLTIDGAMNRIIERQTVDLKKLR